MRHGYIAVPGSFGYRTDGHCFHSSIVDVVAYAALSLEYRQVNLLSRVEGVYVFFDRYVVNLQRIRKRHVPVILLLIAKTVFIFEASLSALGTKLQLNACSSRLTSS